MKLKLTIDVPESIFNRCPLSEMHADVTLYRNEADNMGKYITSCYDCELQLAEKRKVGRHVTTAINTYLDKFEEMNGDDI